MEAWSYKTIRVSFQDFEDELNDLGDKGWRLHSWRIVDPYIIAVFDKYTDSYDDEGYGD